MNCMATYNNSMCVRVCIHQPSELSSEGVANFYVDNDDGSGGGGDHHHLIHLKTLYTEQSVFIYWISIDYSSIHFIF